MVLDDLVEREREKERDFLGFISNRDKVEAELDF